MSDFLPFVDISEYQGAYDMSKNTDALIAIRMSVGTLNRFDLEAARNYANAHAAGKRIIQYHYCGTGDPATEAKLFLSACSPFQQYDMYCIDAESGQSKAWKQTFADTVKEATGCNVIDYMNISTANALKPLPDCALWLAAPSFGFDQDISELDAGIEYLFQQGPVVNGVDSDAAFTTVAVLDKYGYEPATPAVVASPLSSLVVSPPVILPTTETTPTPTPVVTTVVPTPTKQPTVPALSGKKTYSVGFLMIVTAVEKYFTGDHTLSQYLTTIQGLFGSVGILAITIRAAIAKLEKQL